MNLTQISIIIILCCILIFYSIPITKSSIESFANYYQKLDGGACRTARGSNSYPNWKQLPNPTNNPKSTNNPILTEDDCKIACNLDPLCDGYSYNSRPKDNCQLFNANTTQSNYNNKGTDKSYSDIVTKSNDPGWNCNIKKKSYRFYKWVITAVRGTPGSFEVGKKSGPLKVSKIKFYDINKNLISTPIQVIASYNSSLFTDKSNSYAPYKLTNLTDNNSWSDINGPYDPYSNSFGGVVYFDFGKDTPRIEFFDWITSNNEIKYDPISWSLYGTNEDLTKQPAYNAKGFIYNDSGNEFNKLKWDLLHYQDPYIIAEFNTDRIINPDPVTKKIESYMSKRLDILKEAIPVERSVSASKGNLFELTYPNCSCRKQPIIPESVLPPTIPPTIPPTSPPTPPPTIPDCKNNNELRDLYYKLMGIKTNVDELNIYYKNIKDLINSDLPFVKETLESIKTNIDTNSKLFELYKIDSLLKGDVRLRINKT